jgi:hypothetical protein
VTHSHPEGIKGSQATALIVFLESQDYEDAVGKAISLGEMPIRWPIAPAPLPNRTMEAFRLTSPRRRKRRSMIACEV